VEQEKAYKVRIEHDILAVREDADRLSRKNILLAFEFQSFFFMGVVVPQECSTRISLLEPPCLSFIFFIVQL